MRYDYTKKLLVFLFFMFSSFSFSQNPKTFWTRTTKENYSKKDLKFRKTQPTKAHYYNLDIESLKYYLEDTPQRKNKTNNYVKLLDFPTSDNLFETYVISEASVLDSLLQDRHPEIKTYIGKSIKNPSNTIRFSITPKGLHTISYISGSGTEFIDPYSNDAISYIVYSKRDLPPLDSDWSCGFDNNQINLEQRTISNFNANDGIMREFRLALACTIEYSEFHWNAAGLLSTSSQLEKKAAVLAAMVVTINRNNFIYERDLSLTMTIVANNENIIFIDSDNFSNNNSGSLINESQTVIDDIIGWNNYDIGHTFSTGGGGLAALNSPCTSSKARGVTGSSNPVGDSYDVDYVAHELGHQFGAPHTFNGDGGGCGSNRSGSNAYEPGSGSTIMAYAGLCSPQNVQSNSDAYFHQKSLQMMWDNITIGNSTCAIQMATGNTAPTVSAGNNYNIPASTPYKLTGSSADIDGTMSHTFNWEQYDLGPAGPPMETNFEGPLVRSFEATASPIRHIPKISDILSNGGVSSDWEKLASVDRDINFKLTVRDNDTRGGQTASAQMLATVKSAAGPFLVTSQNINGQSWIVGSTETITWDVAGTTSNGINEMNVDILFSKYGVRYDTVLAAGVPNDGSHDITVPNVSSSSSRVMVVATSNIFFNINTQNITVGLEEVCETFDSEASLNLEIPDGIAANNAGNPLVLSLDITDDVTISDLNFNIDIAHTYINDLVIILKHPDGTQSVVFDRNCGSDDNLDITFDDESTSAIVCGSPTIGTYQSGNTPLSNFDELSAAGTWLIEIYDYHIGDTGILNDYSIEICSESSLNTGDIELDNLRIFPNPNNGSFTVGFNTRSGKNISVQVYDIRGRMIYKNNYTTNIRFEEVISLTNTQSGIYILQISDGPQKITKKIVVN